MARSLRAPISWVVYDLANTIYSAIVVTFLILPYTKSVLSAATLATTANFVSMVLAGIVAPAFGEVTDRAGTSKRWLAITTTISCAACLLMAAFHFGAPRAYAVYLVLLAFCAANFCYQLALVFYNSLLPGLVPEDRIGLWSGIGIGVGYFGTTVGMVVLKVVFWATDGTDETTAQMAWGFGSAGVFFLLLALPLFLWVPERSPTAPDPAAPRTLPEALRRSLFIWKRNLKEPVTRRFLIGNFCLTDVLNTTIFVFSLYCWKVFDAVTDITDDDLTNALIALSLGAFLLGIVCGRVADRLGPKTALLTSAVALGLALLAGVLLPASAFWVMVAVLSTLGAFGLAGIWTAGRALLVRIAPRERLGEYFGMYGLSLKISVFGALLFGLLSDHLPFAQESLRYRFALASGFVTLSIGTWLIATLRVDRTDQER